MNEVQLPRPITQGLLPQNTQAQFNNHYAAALAAGDPRYAIKKYDRPGVSRGGAQLNQAGIDAAQNLADGIAEAYSRDAQNAAYNANIMLQAQRGVEDTAQNLGGFQSQAAYQDQMAALAQQQAFNAMVGGMFSSPAATAPALNLQGLLAGPAISAPRFSLPDPSQQLAALQSADNSRGLLGALLQ